MNMGYKVQLKEWLDEHPNATVEEAWIAGYWQSTDNWCKHERQIIIGSDIQHRDVQRC